MSQPSKISGATDSTIGTAKQMAGQALGYVAPESGASLENTGAQQHAKGETETKAAQAQGYVEGMIDKAFGKKDSVVGAVTGDNAQKAQGEAKEQKGDIKTSINNPTA
ncbi:unnamed protein product [Tilletia controversa]|uniref:CsbD-like domain-containing protein n=3 Tax=Tilletia TaxID=13289 RepID=A0A8X7MPM3_9BASI|nr:hypothetical protein CF336_g5936 [Tilletia laevis]KAE8192007.1 hypothetical protein CF328_g5510 [Tilletia controversa]KAE8261398.1 hypothetical protein A4X03_0g3291 [Tilletia caries]KAE8195058.1 hypothetical protein CF335_g5187 [Tilletia laevis]KAE8243378.1 hypothetical protein A4X06_0g6360 [Tilletia controversa]